jgi:hypothetical protein
VSGILTGDRPIQSELQRAEESHFAAWGGRDKRPELLDQWISRSHDLVQFDFLTKPAPV